MKKHPFGEYIQQKRIKAGLSQRGLARSLNLSHPYVWEVENGRSGPMAPRHWDRLIQAIPGVTEEELGREYLESIPVRIRVYPDHPDHLLLLQLQKVLQDQLELSHTQRVGITNILSTGTGRDTKRPDGCYELLLSNNHLWGISQALLHFMAHIIKSMEAEKDKRNREDWKRQFDACVSAQAAITKSAKGTNDPG